MSLRIRIVLIIGLLFSVVMGALVAGYEAKRTLQAELGAALVGGEQTARSAFEDLPRSDHPARNLRQLVAAFDGDRHLRVALVDGTGRVVVVSRMESHYRPPPAWFAGLLGLGATPRPVSLSVPMDGLRSSVLRLEPIAGPDLDALWHEFTGVVFTLIGSAIVGLVLVYIVIGAAMTPLHALFEGFGRIGDGDYSGRVRELGPPELVRLERAFNSMAERLSAMQSKNRVLEIQLANIQDEERADLARDLHDEIGPYLFAVKIDAQIVGGLICPSCNAKISERLDAIQAAAAHMQQLVREILSRLRPTRVTELGLNAAIGDLVEFWKERCPDVALEVSLISEEDVPEPVKDTVYRVVQEALSNAMRHGDAARVDISVAFSGADELVVQVADDGAKRTTNADGGYGLVGMRERVQPSRGVLQVDTGETHGGGWVVTARLPLGAPVSAKEVA
jgi:two-component system sensor histidine kinase UhpB